MLIIKSFPELKLDAVYTDRLGLHLDDTPKLLGHVHFDFISRQWTIEAYLRPKGTRRVWRVKNRENGLKSLAKLEAKLASTL